MTEESLKLLKNLSILIVEDDDMARQMLLSGLKPYCKDVFEAADGLEGLEKFNKFNVDIILTDIHMPMLNGFDMIKKILAVKPHQKFIVFTSYDTDNNLLKSVEAGAALFLTKPINIQDLRSMLITLTCKADEKLVKISDKVAINLAKEKIYKDGQEVYLTFLQNKFFWLFAYNLNKLVTYDMIEEFVYENEPINKSAIQNAVSRLKKELGINIKNHFESGYVLAVE
ncbi:MULTISPECIES: response regulator transcription factor [Campylobacter]|uniref:response regulator transcription factor n=1 Tax=Campylobacter TaxID=194 RepID=UPI0014744AF5|nr:MULTISPECIES: response regulator [unclassified Campylobacter]MBE3610390.1 response regulator [Campylobacter sp. RM12916]